MSFGGKVFGGALALGAVYGAGVYIDSRFDFLPECAFPNPTDCIPEGHKEPTGAEFGAISVESEDLVGTASVRTFGEVLLKINQEKSTFDWDDPATFDDPGVEATIYYNEDSDKPTEVLYNPCIVLGQDYTQTFSDHPQNADPNVEPATLGPAEPPRAELNYIADIAPDGQHVDKVTVETGYLDTCFIRLPNTPNNKLLWTNHPSNTASFGDTERATLEWMVDERILKYAASVACPERILDLVAVEETVKQTVIGDLILRKPEIEALFTPETEWDIDIQGPEVRQQHYREVFEQTENKIAGMTESFPQPNRDGKTYPLLVKEMGDVEVVDCSIPATEVRVEPVNE